MAKVEFKEMLHFACGIEVINGRWKLCHHCGIITRTKRKNKSRPRFHDAIDFVQMSLRVAPKIQRVHCIDTIKTLGRVGDL
jgi:hypothetical protein